MSSVGIIKWGDNHLFILLPLVTDTQWPGFQVRKLKTNSQPPASVSIEVAEALGPGPAGEWCGVLAASKQAGPAQGRDSCRPHSLPFVRENTFTSHPDLAPWDVVEMHTRFFWGMLLKMATFSSSLSRNSFWAEKWCSWLLFRCVYIKETRQKQQVRGGD